MVGRSLRGFLPKADLLPYIEAVVDTYNMLGRRDNRYKARIKITVHETGLARVRELIEARFAELRPQYSGTDQDWLAHIRAQFAPSPLQARSQAIRETAYAITRSSGPGPTPIPATTATRTTPS